MADEFALTVQGLPEIQRIMGELPALVAAKIFVHAGAAFNDVIETALIAVTPEMDANESGGRFDSPGSLKDDIDSFVDVDTSLRGVRAGVGFKTPGQADVANDVEFGHRMVTHAGKDIGEVPPHPFMRTVWDGSAPEQAIAAVTEVFEREIPGLIP